MLIIYKIYFFFTALADTTMGACMQFFFYIMSRNKKNHITGEQIRHFSVKIQTRLKKGHARLPITLKQMQLALHWPPWDLVSV